jgi:hypothetical protein
MQVTQHNFILRLKLMKNMTIAFKSKEVQINVVYVPECIKKDSLQKMMTGI